MMKTREDLMMMRRYELIDDTAMTGRDGNERLMNDDELWKNRMMVMRPDETARPRSRTSLAGGCEPREEMIDEEMKRCDPRGHTSLVCGGLKMKDQMMAMVMY